MYVNFSFFHFALRKIMQMCGAVSELYRNNHVKWIRIFGPNEREKTEGWRELHKEDLYNKCIYSALITIKVAKLGIKWAEHVWRMKYMPMRNTKRILV
jgi:hypothetical protein